MARDEALEARKDAIFAAFDFILGGFRALHFAMLAATPPRRLHAGHDMRISRVLALTSPAFSLAAHADISRRQHTPTRMNLNLAGRSPVGDGPCSPLANSSPRYTFSISAATLRFLAFMPMISYRARSMRDDADGKPPARLKCAPAREDASGFERRLRFSLLMRFRYTKCRPSHGRLARVSRELLSTAYAHFALAAFRPLKYTPSMQGLDGRLQAAALTAMALSGDDAGRFSGIIGRQIRPSR